MKLARPCLRVYRTAVVTACLWTAAVTPSLAGMQVPAASPDASPGRHAAERASARAEAEALLRNRGAVLAADFLAEPHDAAWAASAGKVLRRVLGDRTAGAPMAGASIECRSRTCRIELVKPDAAALSERLPRLALRLAADFPSMAVAPGKLPSGQPVTRVYLSRSAGVPAAATAK